MERRRKEGKEWKKRKERGEGNRRGGGITRVYIYNPSDQSFFYSLSLNLFSSLPPHPPEEIKLS